MKPFNLEEAKAGKAVQTRDGRKVRIICFDRNQAEYPLVGLVGKNEQLYSFSNEGKFYGFTNDSNDLFMAPEVVWVNVYGGRHTELVCRDFYTKEEADRHAAGVRNRLIHQFSYEK